MRLSLPLSRPGRSILLLALVAVSCTAQGPSTNFALRHRAYHSSAMDFNATAQLAVDGIVETETPYWIEVSRNDGELLSKIEHDMPFDPRPWSTVTEEGPHAELGVRTHGFRELVDQITMTFSATLRDGRQQGPFSAQLLSQDGTGQWNVEKQFQGIYAGQPLTLLWDAPRRMAPERWKFVVDMPDAESITWQQWLFFRDGKLLTMLASEHFNSVWTAASAGTEWLAVDLGQTRNFREVRLHWINAPAHGVLQVGADSTSWHTVAEFGGDRALRCDSLRLHGRGRWVRVLLDSSVDGMPYMLSEFEVLGGGRTKSLTTPECWPVEATSYSGNDSRIQLDRNWIVARQPQSNDPADWIPSTVPGTVLSSYLDQHMLPNPNFGDNQQYISDSYFLSPFVYRTRFSLPHSQRSGLDDERLLLHFDGINWKAMVFLNGSSVGIIEGAFTDAAFDITSLLTADNRLEVVVMPPDHPGMTKANTLERCASNGGVLGADNPTFHASIGWDWIPTIRGRNTGIWNDVWLERIGPVEITEPTATALFTAQESLPPILDTTRVRIKLGARLVNRAGYPVETIWEGSYGDVPFSKTVLIPAGSASNVSTEIIVEHPKLWWPNGYGDPHLYDVTMRVGGSHSCHFSSGIRRFDYDVSDGSLRIWVNGRRLVGRGGNWGFSESNLRYKAEDYERAMQLHRHENFNLVRNWVGMIGDEEFYDAADRNGILIWQDFWLANPADGPDPDDEAMFMANAENMLKRIRNHPSLLLWCGRNEGYPPASLDAALRGLVAREDPMSYYISSSADDVVSGRGPYFRLPSKTYWMLDQTPWYRNETRMFHSERGMPNFPNYESLLEMMPASQTWPPTRMWGIHDFALQSAQRGQTFIDAVEAYFGPTHDGQTFAERAQWVNYDGYRAMFESRSRERRGLLLWMSHPAWPSMAFCTYDWFLDGTAAYYACRKACEPLHIQWNPVTERVEVVNYSAGEQRGLRAVAQLYTADGVRSAARDTSLAVREDSTVELFGMNFAQGGLNGNPRWGNQLCFLRLQLFEGTTLVSHNDYVITAEEDNLKQLNTLPSAHIKLVHKPARDGQPASIVVTNTSETPALMLHFVARRGDGSRILPTFWSDNYIHLMPREERTLTYTTPDDASHAMIEVQGFNVPLVEMIAR
jgi:hypothetical protein